MMKNLGKQTTKVKKPESNDDTVGKSEESKSQPTESAGGPNDSSRIRQEPPPVGEEDRTEVKDMASATSESSDGDLSQHEDLAVPQPGGLLMEEQNKLVQIALSDMVLDSEMQGRAVVNNEQVQQYADGMARGDKFPPPTVFLWNDKYAVIDGGHRFLAAQKAGKSSLRCELFGGTKDGAIKIAIAANATHGLPRTNADKRHAVTLALKTFPGQTNRQVAKLSCVTHPFVATVRKELESVTTPGDENRAESNPKGTASKKSSTPKKRKEIDGNKSDSQENQSEPPADNADERSEHDDPPSSPNDETTLTTPGESNGPIEPDFDELDMLCSKIIEVAKSLLLNDDRSLRDDVHSRLEAMQTEIEELQRESLPQKEPSQV